MYSGTDASAVRAEDITASGVSVERAEGERGNVMRAPRTGMCTSMEGGSSKPRATLHLYIYTSLVSAWGVVFERERREGGRGGTYRRFHNQSIALERALHYTEKTNKSPHHSQIPDPKHKHKTLISKTYLKYINLSPAPRPPQRYPSPSPPSAS